MTEIVANFASYQAEFAIYLVGQKHSDLSVKSAVADLGHFLNWYGEAPHPRGFRLSQSNSLTNILSFRALEQYFSFFAKTEPAGVLKRRLAALSSFSQFAVEKEWLPNNVSLAFQKLADKQMSLLKRTENILQSFKESLQKAQNNPNTIRGYLADVTEYLQVNPSL